MEWKLRQVLPYAQVSGNSFCFRWPEPQIALAHKFLKMADQVYYKLNYLLNGLKINRQDTLKRQDKQKKYR